MAKVYKGEKAVFDGNLRIEYEPNSARAGKLCYLLMTQDAASLEARVATSDTALNPSGIDKTLYNVYDPVHGNGDLHSQTAFNTFCKSINMQINEAVDENGKTWLYLDSQMLKVNRNGTEIVVKGSEILETDTILDYED
jgi:hypothetical protein